MGIRQDAAESYLKFLKSTMNLMHIKYAVEVANEGSINKAAEAVCRPDLNPRHQGLDLARRQDI